MRSPERLGMIRIEVLRRRHIAPSPVSFHLSQNAPHVVFRVAEMHQLSLIRGFKDRVSNPLAMGEQAKASLTLG